MRALRSASLAVWGFLVGDDWLTALGVCAALALVAAIAALGIAAWWVLPLAVPALLWLSLLRVIRRGRSG
ncbi:MAG TPA: hypothetical protein VGI76_03585 [Solirubrobacteraceae bacterium]|jgi:hypothetical protein